MIGQNWQMPFSGKRKKKKKQHYAPFPKLRLCLVAVKCFPENTYFPEMLISGKGKCFHGVWLHCKKFFGKYFLVFGKEKGKLKSENAE